MMIRKVTPSTVRHHISECRSLVLRREEELPESLQAELATERARGRHGRAWPGVYALPWKYLNDLEHRLAFDIEEHGALSQKRLREYLRFLKQLSKKIESGQWRG